MQDYRSLSLWFDQVQDDLTPRPALGGAVSVDVAIVGGGLTGLWTAYYLQQLDPRLRIAVVEKDIAGFGASGRNGGWCSALFPVSFGALTRRYGRDRAAAMRRAMIDTVDEVGRVTRAEGIDCDFELGGTITFARSAAQLAAARSAVAESTHWGVDEVRFIDGTESSGTGLGANGAIGATITPVCARLQPAALVRQLATTVTRRGAQLFEHTPAVAVRPGLVETPSGRVSADHVVIATEAYGATLPGMRRRTLPLYSLMIATEPLSDEIWNDLGIAHGQTFTDYRHLTIYGQRTADNRIAFGGRGARYHWGSSIRGEYDRVPRVFDHLTHALHNLFPQVAGAAITHRWGGPLGVARDWHASVTLDAASRILSAGGYVGDGLSTTNLAGRTMADLIIGVDSPISRLPWVGHQSPPWEPEPWRFLGANLGLAAMAVADVEERVTGRPSILARATGRLTGH